MWMPGNSTAFDMAKDRLEGSVGETVRLWWAVLGHATLLLSTQHSGLSTRRGRSLAMPPGHERQVSRTIYAPAPRVVLA